MLATDEHSGKDEFLMRTGSKTLSLAGSRFSSGSTVRLSSL
jgi:hypothetical protein